MPTGATKEQIWRSPQENAQDADAAESFLQLGLAGGNGRGKRSWKGGEGWIPPQAQKKIGFDSLTQFFDFHMSIGSNFGINNFAHGS